MEAEPKFEVRDRRLRFDDTPASAPPAAAGPTTAGASESTRNADSVAHRAAAAEPAGAHELFSGLALSIAASGLAALGEPPDGAAPPDFPAAQQTIDLLTCLEQKTRGNLTPEETHLLSELLYTLRVKFVDVARANR
jgi:hypothetical protein